MVTHSHRFVEDYSGLVGFGMSACYIPISATIVRWFVARRGTALAIFSMGACRTTGNPDSFAQIELRVRVSV